MVTNSRPNVWTEWAEFCCGHLWVFTAKRRALQLELYVFEIYLLYNKTYIYIFMLPIAGQTAGPNGLIFFNTHGVIKIEFFSKFFFPTCNAGPFS